MPKKKYGEMTIGQLKDELRSKHAKLSGRKADLVERYVMGRVIIGYIAIIIGILASAVVYIMLHSHASCLFFTPK